MSSMLHGARTVAWRRWTEVEIRLRRATSIPTHGIDTDLRGEPAFNSQSKGFFFLRKTAYVWRMMLDIFQWISNKIDLASRLELQ